MSAKRWRRTRITSRVEYIQTRFNRPNHLFFSVYLVLATLCWPTHPLASLSKICAPTMFPGSMVAIHVMIVGVGITIMLKVPFDSRDSCSPPWSALGSVDFDEEHQIP